MSASPATRSASTWGGLLGGGGARLRLYSHAGLRLGTISRIVTFVFATNWLGYGVLAGTLLVSGLAPLPGGMTATVGLVVGLAMLATVVSYLLATVRWRHRTWQLRGHTFELPSPRLALLQLSLSVPNWLAIAAILFVLLRYQVDYPTLLGVVLLGAVAAAITHIPAGLGALEVIFLTLLGDRLSQAELLAALLAYRAIYYLAPPGIGRGQLLCPHRRHPGWAAPVLTTHDRHRLEQPGHPTGCIPIPAAGRSHGNSQWSTSRKANSTIR
ncbi:putative bifunctional lysylphosphatidylglycerol flippase/synthetase [Marilutibacter alkalisoli]|uniref:UPF0104 family protein n=1 Tax=Marilutibacter alkalisoli TaxID=2591633 RepID=A0A514BN97_9GAMM|nr:lysylphosphatidylglycerol synthase domain-containing protein [Lysobacter alkalisoli]QDH68863.1 UPF0104 family protein [Lysobacter alkalisoli]